MTRLIHTIQRMVILSTTMGVLALLISFSFEDGRFGFMFLAGAFFGVICDAIVHWFWAHDGWFTG